MSTSNIGVTTTGWSKIVDANDSDFLVTWNVARVVEFATTDVDIPPVIAGHRFTREKAVTREDLGTGYLWARLISDSSIGLMQLSVSKTNSVVGATGGFDSIEGVQKVAMLVWNPATLSWERSSGSGGGGSGDSVAVNMTKRIEQLSNLIYIGQAVVGTEESSNVWAIKRVELNPEGSATAVKLGIGSWTNRSLVTYQ